MFPKLFEKAKLKFSFLNFRNGGNNSKQKAGKQSIQIGAINNYYRTTDDQHNKEKKETIIKVDLQIPMINNNYAVSIYEVPKGFDVRLLEKHETYFLVTCTADKGYENRECTFRHEVKGYASI